MISIENLGIEFSAKALFRDVNFVINQRERIALVGKNGAGKSTMLRIIAGLQEPTEGRVSRPKECTIGYLPQVMKIADSTTVREETIKVFEGTGTEEWEIAAQMDRTLTGLGFERKDMERPTAEFSGGWRMRIELAKILLQKPDVLLLDEPTNHLDIESIQWLERFLQTAGCAVVLISHDRAFLDNVTTRTIEITCGTIHDYNVSYSKYVSLHAERIEQQRRAYENQQKLIQETRDFIERFRYQATKAIQVQSRIKQLEKIIPIEIDEVDNSSLHLKFPPAPRSGDYPVICNDVRKVYTQSSSNGETHEHLVFDHIDLTIKRGEKVAFVGKNGEGKSTLVKCIMNEIPFDGELKVGYGVKIGYFAQNQAQLLDENLTVFDTIDRVAVGDIRTKIRDILGAFMFGGEAIEKQVKVLSGGERSRLAMIKLLLEPVNLLILDEPTNHLDMRSKQVLKEAIQAFDGTVIVVSHDRDFLDGLVSRVYEFKNQRIREHLGGIYDWLKKQAEEDVKDKLSSNQKSSNPSSSNPSSNSGPSSSNPSSSNLESKVALSFTEQKARKAQISKLEKQIQTAEKEMSDLQAKIDKLEAEMATPEGSQNQQLYVDHAALKKQQDDVSFTWLELSEQLEALS